MSALSIAPGLLADLGENGAEVYIYRHSVRVKGPARALTAETYQKIIYYQEELIELLWSESPEPLPQADFAAAHSERFEAVFAGNFHVQVRQQGSSRWMIWFKQGSLWHRRKDFASPHADHAMRTAVYWFGDPVIDWKDAVDPLAQPPGSPQNKKGEPQ